MIVAAGREDITWQVVNVLLCSFGHIRNNLHGGRRLCSIPIFDTVQVSCGPLVERTHSEGNCRTESLAKHWLSDASR